MSVKLIFAFGAVTLVACVSAASTACGCTDNPNPVCARQGDKWITYINKCHAECQHAEDIVEGSCRPPGKAAAHKRVKKDSPPCACLDIWDPVCGSDGRTYDNPQCAQSCYGVTDYTEGSCSDENESDEADSRPCSCTRIYAPVCANGVDYANEDCAVNCGGVTDFTHGRCDGTSIDGRPSCQCTLEYSPVCSADGQQRYPNPCVAECHGLTNPESCPDDDEDRVANLPFDDSSSSSDQADGPPCACNLAYDPICAEGVDHPSLDCAVRCGGVTSFRPGTCSSGTNSDTSSEQEGGGFACPCEAMYAPICADGMEYPNLPCARRCYGVTDYTNGPCDSSSE